jgi:hypothetical protein
MKNRREAHAFRIVGGGDPEQDGPDPQFWRVAVECARCGETRRIGAPLDEVNAGGGCRREGPDEPWQRGDLLVARGVFLDEYQDTLPGGMVITWNGQYREWHPSVLVPKT